MNREKIESRKRRRSTSKETEKRKHRHRERDRDNEKEKHSKKQHSTTEHEGKREKRSSHKTHEIEKQKRGERDREHNRDRNRVREHIRDRDHERERSPLKKSEVKKVEKQKEQKKKDLIIDENLKKAALEAEQKQLLAATEEERRKRKERIQAWQEKIKLENPEIISEAVGKEWNLEDEQDDEAVDDVVQNVNETGDSINPLKDNIIKSGDSIKPLGDNMFKAGDSIKPLDDNMHKAGDRVKPSNDNMYEADEGIDPLDAYMHELKKSMVNQKSQAAKTIVKEEEDEKTHFVETIVTMQQPLCKKDDEILEQFGDAAEYSEEESEKDEEPPDFFNIKKNIKVLPPIDHKKVYYRDFRKDFYVQVPEIAKMTDIEVGAYREELDNIQVRGKKVPKPVKKWVQLGLNPKVLEVLKKLKYEKPTSIQAQAIPAVMSGRDVIGIARTGSGKTLAFILPLFRHVLDQPQLEEGDGPIALVLTPTRELAMQITRECRKFTRFLGLTAICVFGGSVVSEQISELKRGAEIVICTPGRMIDMLTVNCGKIINLHRVTFVVLDEADRMFDMGFEPQVYKIMQQIRPDRQMCLFTATFPVQMEALARKILDKPIEIIAGTRNKVNVEIKQHLLLLTDDDKFLKLLEILGMYADAGPILIFVEKQESADELLRDLMVKGHPCMTIHGGRDQYDRDSTLNDFKNGNTSILIATSVCARGIDVKNIVLVINYDCPNHSEEYIHRCGRTGRAGSKGTAITFVTTKDARYIKDIISVIDPESCEIPPNIVNLHQRFMAIDKNRRSKNSGFSGHGYKFDDREFMHSIESRKMIKWSFGWQDSGDEAEAEDKILRKIEHDVEKAFSNRPKTTTKEEDTAPVDKEKISRAQIIGLKLNEKLKASDIVVGTREYNEVVKPIVKPRLESTPVNTLGLDIAKEIAGKMNIKMNVEAVTAPKRETVKKVAGQEIYYEEIDVNDFPTLARQRITLKETLDAVADFSDCSLSVRGSYCPSGKSIDIADRRLHLLIEGNTEFKVQLAKAEIKRVIKEECVKSDYVFTQASSRYKIT